MKLVPAFSYDSVRHDIDTDAHLVISLTAPQVETSKRPPLCIVLVADNSGSMEGEKLHYAKLSMQKLVDNLSPGDTCGLVVFSTAAREQFKAVKMTAENKAALKAQIGKIRTEGGTNFASGMMLGCKVANNLDVPLTTLVRVIMFSDGQPTHGIATTADGLRTILEKERDRATVSMFGFGGDASHDLLTALSTEGKGNYAHVANPDSALSAFGKELGGLLSSYADDIVLTVTPHSGHSIREVLSDVDVDEEIDGEVTIKVPSMLAEEVQHIVLAMKLGAQKSAGPRAVNAAAVKLTYRILENGAPVRKEADAKAKVQFVKSGDEQKKPTKALDEIVARAQLAKSQAEAEKLASQGNFMQAQQVMQLTTNGLVDRGHDHLGSIGTYVSNMYESNASYGASSGSRNVMRTAMTRGGYRVSGLRAEDEAVLRASKYEVSTTSQAQTSASFAEPAQPAADDAQVGQQAIDDLAAQLGIAKDDPDYTILPMTYQPDVSIPNMWYGVVPPPGVVILPGTAAPVSVPPTTTGGYVHIGSSTGAPPASTGININTSINVPVGTDPNDVAERIRKSMERLAKAKEPTCTLVPKPEKKRKLTKSRTSKW